MKRLVVWALCGVLSVMLVALAGCGGGSGGNAVTTPQAQQMVTSVSWLFDNTPSDYNATYNCSLITWVYYDVTIAPADIDSFIVTSPSGARWTPTAAASTMGTSSSGRPYISRRLTYGDHETFPLAGTWSFQLKLKNGAVSAPFQHTFHNPGSSAAATYSTVYSPEDALAISTNAGPLLRRFPSTGFSLHYSPANGGSITSTGLAPVADAYRAQEPRAFNTNCWLYDANGNYLGNSAMAFSTVDHSNSGLITPAGELNLVPSLTVTASGPGTVDLARVSYLRVVAYDGGQYAPTTYSSWDNRAVSAKISVQPLTGRALEEAVLYSGATTGATFLPTDTLGDNGGSAVGPDGESSALQNSR